MTKGRVGRTFPPLVQRKGTLEIASHIILRKPRQPAHYFLEDPMPRLESPSNPLPFNLVYAELMPLVAALVLCPLLAFSSWSQTTTFPPQPSPLSEVQAYLDLTNDQAKAILQNNDDYNTFSLQQQQQIQQGQSEIAIETAKVLLSTWGSSEGGRRGKARR
jgi:hypothetical protein